MSVRMKPLWVVVCLLALLGGVSVGHAQGQEPEYLASTKCCDYSEPNECPAGYTCRRATPETSCFIPYSIEGGFCQIINPGNETLPPIPVRPVGPVWAPLQTFRFKVACLDMGSTENQLQVALTPSFTSSIYDDTQSDRIVSCNGLFGSCLPVLGGCTRRTLERAVSGLELFTTYYWRVKSLDRPSDWSTTLDFWINPFPAPEPCDSPYFPEFDCCYEGSGYTCQGCGEACCDGGWDDGSACDCTDECTSGQRDCINSSNYSDCGYHDADSCTEWGPILSCPSGYSCRETPPGCDPPVSCDECGPEGSTTCDSSSRYRICEVDDGCLRWSASIPCSTGHCASGSCFECSHDSHCPHPDEVCNMNTYTCNNCDLDGDGFWRNDSICGGTDCCASDPDAHPGAAPADSPTACMQDRDGDDYGAELPVGCSGATPGSDCIDQPGFEGINPGAPEVCGNTRDDDCDGMVDEADCVSCTSHADCAGDPSHNVCDFSTGNCVECTQDTHCGCDAQGNSCPFCSPPTTCCGSTRYRCAANECVWNGFC